MIGLIQTNSNDDNDNHNDYDIHNSWNGSSSRHGSCKEMWAQLVCASCDPRVAVDYHFYQTNPLLDVLANNNSKHDKISYIGNRKNDDAYVFVCSDLCDDVYSICKNEFFTGDIPTPCRERDIVCARLGDWFSSGAEMCNTMQMQVVDSGGSGRRCYNGLTESPWTSLVNARQRKQGRTESRKDKRARTDYDKWNGGKSKERHGGWGSFYKQAVTFIGKAIAISLVGAAAVFAAYFKTHLTTQRRRKSGYILGHSPRREGDKHLNDADIQPFQHEESSENCDKTKSKNI